MIAEYNHRPLVPICDCVSGRSVRDTALVNNSKRAGNRLFCVRDTGSPILWYR